MTIMIAEVRSPESIPGGKLSGGSRFLTRSSIHIQSHNMLLLSSVNPGHLAFGHLAFGYLPSGCLASGHFVHDFLEV